MMAILSKRHWKIWSINLCFGLSGTFASAAFGQSLSDLVVALDTGQWDHKQSTYINGSLQNGLNLNGSQCLTESEANLTVQDYADKMMKGLGMGASDESCDFSNINAQAGSVNFDLMCTSSAGGSTKLHIAYNHTRVLAKFEASGTITGNGYSIPIRVEGGSSRVGDCKDENKSAGTQREAKK